MATEATVEKPVDVSVTDTSLPHARPDSTDRDPHNGDAANAPRVNRPRSGSLDEIENKDIAEIAEIVDELVNSAAVSVSGGSDTEASTKANKLVDDKGHVRTSSTVKKPQSFKSVSVNRTFLAAKSAQSATARPETSTASANSTIPTGSTGSSASKLKLVAKSASSLGGSSKTVATNGKTSGAPDPSSVWNRNRPVPPPEPKKLSDEELMSKYGIHMADRLRPEDDRGQNNWADIDDDEDWAPETITWTDGTKITLPQADESQPPPATQSATEKPKSPVPAPAPATTSTTSATSATIATSTSAKASPSVKPGVLASGKGLVLKGVPEKPTLVAKAPAPPTPVKSPWATLPPVNKQPVIMNLSEQQVISGPVPRGYSSRDAASTKSMTPPPPTKEISADDFSRSWRESGQGGGNRELFNSHSGRYEPVQERRGSRNQPALLQRQSATHEQQGPAEPSPAFQTSRTSQDSLPYGRRRGSSNVSGGSGSLANRLGKPHDITTVPYEMGQAGPGTASPVSPGPFSPVASHPTPRSHHAQPWQPRPSPSQTHAVPHIPQPTQTEANATVMTEETIELQKRLMRERREMAIKRRMEEEAREEAAKKERIRLKLEAMGPAPERKSAKKDDARDATIALQLRRDSPPAGLMHMADDDKEKSESVASNNPSPAARRDSSIKADSQVNGVQRGVSQATSSRPSQTAPWPETHAQHPDRISSGWSSSAPGTRNVWAAPGNDRSLGNGTFNSDISHLTDSQPAQPSSMTSRPAPIGPPRSATQSQQKPEPTARIAPIGPPSGTTQAPGGRSVARNPWANADIAADDRTIRMENQKRREDQAQSLNAQGKTLDDAQPLVKDKWRPVSLGKAGNRVTAAAQNKLQGEAQEAPSKPSWNSANEASRGEAPEPIPSRHDYRQPSEFGMPPPTGTAGRSAPRPAQVRAGSRFFPQSGSRDVRLEDAGLKSRSKSPTPPPPTMDDHPAYDGDITRPHVLLPPMKPVVRLPPSSAKPTPASTFSSTTAPAVTSKPVAPISFAAAVAAPSRVTAQPPSRGIQGTIAQRSTEITTQENWQEKINTLIGRKPVSSYHRPVSVDSASKSALDDTFHPVPALVSLPSLSPSGSTSTDDTSFTSKEMAEEFLGEQEMGSLPFVCLPNKVPDALYQAVEPNWGTIPAKFRVDAMAAEMARFPLEYVNNKCVIRISVPGMEESKTVLAPHPPRSKSNPRRQLPRGSRHVSGRGQRRDGSGFNGDHNSVPSSDRPERSERPTSNRGRGGFRARSDNWHRQSASAQVAQS